MRVAHVVPSIADEASGPTYSVPRLCEALAKRDVTVELHVLNPCPYRDLGPAHLLSHDSSRFPPGFGWSWSMATALRRAAPELAILHNHSLWMAPNVYPGLSIRGTRCRLVCSPRGTLLPAALRRRAWLKRALWACGQKLTVVRAALLHATSEAEEQSLRQLGFTQPIARIPNGIDMPAPLESRSSAPGRTILYLGRLHPIKGVDLLIRAWARISAEHAGVRLLIVGPGSDEYRRELQSLAGRLEGARIEFQGPTYGEAKARLYRNATVFALPSRSENFGMAVAEALAHGLPVVVSRSAPWAGVITHRCGWWIDADEQALATTLDEALRLPRDRLADMGAAGRSWMQREFSWPTIAERMIDAYRWILGEGDRPPDVHMAPEPLRPRQ